MGLNASFSPGQRAGGVVSGDKGWKLLLVQPFPPRRAGQQRCAGDLGQVTLGLRKSWLPV